MSENQYIVSERPGVLQFQFNRPEKYNAFTKAMFAGLREALSRFRRDPALRVFVMRSSGKYFCSGIDVMEMGAPAQEESTADFRQFYREVAQHDLFDELELIEKPIVVAHQGPCLGAGLEMSLSCDFRLAAKGASYALPEFNLGMMPGSGGTSRLVRVVGAHWARWLITANQKISAERALAIGMVHDVYADEEFDQKVDAFCDHLAAQPPEAVAMSKLAIELAADLDRAQGRVVERLANSALYIGDERKKMLQAMRERLSRGKS